VIHTLTRAHTRQLPRGHTIRWIAIVSFLVVGLLVVVGGIAALIGSQLPTAHVAARLARFKQPPNRVFAAISDFAQMPTWRSDISRVELLPAEQGRAVFREHGNDAITYRVEAIDPPRRLVVRIANTDLPFGGTWTYEVAPLPGGATALTITERGEVYNLVFRFMSRIVFSQHATIDTYLRALGTKFGESVTPEPAAPR
jgi:uncharacterized protein YndB with AHSA1/START domain